MESALTGIGAGIIVLALLAIWLILASGRSHRQIKQQDIAAREKEQHEQSQ